MTDHHWKFARVGGFDQVVLDSGDDLVHIGELDQKLWVALACPVKGIEFDERTLELIDTDKDGRVRASELIAAAEWAGKMLSDVEMLAKGADSLELDAVGEHEDAKQVRASAEAVLASIGKAKATAISVADTSNAIDAFNARTFNGDGVVTPEAAGDETTKQLVLDVLACTAPVPDKSGKSGVTKETVATFLEELATHAAWLVEGEGDATTRPFDGAAAAFAAVSEVRAKVEDFFARTRVAAFDTRAVAAVNLEEGAYAAIAAKELDAKVSELYGFPLARVTPNAALPLESGVNPAWAALVSDLRTRAVKPALGDRQQLTDADWRVLLTKLAGYEAWASRKKGSTVEKLGAERVRILVKGDAKAKLEALLAEEKKAEPLAHAIESVERLVRYTRDLMKLANNFVCFRDFYSRTTPATFQVGTLYLDQRACQLCIAVTDAGRHVAMAPLSNCYLLYCDIKNASGETRTLAAAMTNGDVDNLMVGRNGIFYDRAGKDWDATVTKIIENPISVRQAFWSPYKKALRLIEEAVAKRAAAADTEANAKLGKAVESGAASEPEPAKEASKIDIGTVAALGVAVGGITAALGVVMASLFGLGLWMPLGLVGLMFAISGPSMAIAWLKLRKRNLGPLLDANGWAVNAQAKVNVPFGASLTKLAVIPEGSTRSMRDPFAEKERPWGLYILLFAILTLGVAWYLGKVDRLLPTGARSTTILGADAPANAVPTASAAVPAK